MIAPIRLNAVNPQAAGLGLLGPHASQVSNSGRQGEDGLQQCALLSHVRCCF